MHPLILKVDSVDHSFGSRKILQDIYLDCKPGEVIGLLGRNGSGKSTLLKIIFGTLTPNHKYVSINDEYIYKGYYKNRIAYLPQHNYLPKGMQVEPLAKLMVADKHWGTFSNYPAYANHYKKTTNQLSGGELRQLEILMLLYSKADFILLDEPFTHISPVQAESFKMQLREVAKHKGIIITDHLYHNILEVSDRIFLLNDGYTRQISNHEELVQYGYLSSL